MREPNTGRRAAVRWATMLAWAWAALAMHDAYAVPDEIQTHQAGFWGGGTPSRLDCPAGTLLVGIQRQSEQWSTGLRLLCVAIANNGGWSGDIITGPSIGEAVGSQADRVQCPADMFVAAYASGVVRVLASDEVFVSFPSFTCVNLRNGQVDHVGGPLGIYFGIELDSIVMGDREIAGSYGCTPGWAATGVMARMADDRGVDRFGLVCHSQAQFANHPIPTVLLETYRAYVPDSVPMEPAPNTPGPAVPASEVYLTCPGSNRLVGWNTDPSVEGITRVDAICAPVAPGVGWKHEQEVFGDSWQLPGSSQHAIRRYVCPTSSLVVGASRYKRLYGPIADVTPICKSQTDASLTYLPSAGVEPRGPFNDTNADCAVGPTGPGAYVYVGFGSGVREVNPACASLLYVDDPNTGMVAKSAVADRGLCSTQPQLCSTWVNAPVVPAAVPAVVPVVTPAGSDCARVGPAFRVPANGGWCNTRIKLAGAGERLRITATGRWSNAGPPAQGPEGFVNYRFLGTVLDAGDLASLIGRIDASLFPIGARYDGRNGHQGTLWLSINDVPGEFADNQGAVEAIVTVTAE